MKKTKHPGEHKLNDNATCHVTTTATSQPGTTSIANGGRGGRSDGWGGKGRNGGRDGRVAQPFFLLLQV